MKKTTPSPFRYSPPDESKPTIEYVNKAELYEALVVYKKAVEEAVSAECEPPRVSEYIGKCIKDICYGLGNRYNFRNYTFQDEMISVAIVDCLKAVRTFKVDDPRKNAYGYFSFVAFQAMVNVIKKELRYVEGKYKYIRELDINLAAYQEHDEGHGNSLIQYLKDEIDSSSLHEAHEKRIREADQPEDDEPEETVEEKPKKPSKISDLDFL